jgi:cytochrome P450
MPDDFVYLPAPQNMDPPRHTLFAAPLKAAFTPSETMKYEKAIRELTAQCLDPLVGKGRCEFMKDVAEPIPILMFLKIMGVPLDRFAQFRGLALETLNAPSEEAMFNKMVEVDILMTGYIEALRDNPGDDVISRLWKTDMGGRPITLDEMRRFGIMLFTAGLDSVTNGMGHSMHHLARHPELQARLRDNPQEIHATTEELLRRYGVTTPPRRLTRDTVYQGVEMRKEDKVELWVIAGNLDPEAFSDPEEVKVPRSERTHLTFGFGLHRCIGAHLARLELHVLYDVWLKRFPSVRLDPEGSVTYDPGHVLRITQLPLIWDT